MKTVPVSSSVVATNDAGWERIEAVLIDGRFACTSWGPPGGYDGCEALAQDEEGFLLIAASNEEGG